MLACEMPCGSKNICSSVHRRRARPSSLAVGLAVYAHVSIHARRPVRRIFEINVIWFRLSAANMYTYTPIVYNTVYTIFIRHCKLMLVVVYKFLSCRLGKTLRQIFEINVIWSLNKCNSVFKKDIWNKCNLICVINMFETDWGRPSSCWRARARRQYKYK